MAYAVPQVQVFQEFTQVGAEIVGPLRACIVGPHFHLQRYTEFSEKENGLLGDYAPDASSTSYSWPGRPTGAVVDQAYTKVYIDNAYLRYFADATTRSQVLTASRVRHPTKNLVSYTNPVTGIEYERHTSLLRDVQVGDIIRVYGSTLGLPTEEAYSQVVGFIHDQVASAIGTPTFDAANPGTQADTSTAAVTTVTSSADHVVGNYTGANGYLGLPSGDITETYTITVTQGGAPGIATISVLSASGRDDVASTVITAFGADVLIGTRGVKVRFTSATSAAFVTGDKWTLTVGCLHTLATASNTQASTSDSTDPYSGDEDTTYIVTVTRGGKSTDTDKPQVTVTTTDGTDSSGPITITDHTSYFTIGTKNVTMKFATMVAASGGLAKGEKFYIPCTAKADGPIRTMVLNTNLPDNLVPGSGGASSYYFEDVNVELFIKKNIEIDKCDGLTGVTNFSQTATQLTVQGSIVAYDDSWADDDGDLVGLPVRRGSVYVHYRALMQTFVNDINSTSSPTEVESLLGPPVPDNPLSLGVYKATSNSNGTLVKFVAVPTNDSAGYSNALEKLVGRTDVYGIVPMSYDRTVQDLVAAHVQSMSNPTVGRWRVGWLGLEDVPTPLVLETTGKIIDDPDSAGAQYTYVTASAATFLSSGVLPGDLVRTSFSLDLCGNETYDEYTVDQVVNENTLRLVSGPASAINVAQLMEIWRPLSRTGQAQELATTAGSFGTHRIRCVWPDKAKSGDVEMASYIVAAALAGLRSGVVPHQGLTNVELAGFDDIRASYFNADQLNVMAAAGVWVVTSDPNTGQVYTRHQVTTGDTNIVAKREDSMVTNLDSISYYFLNALAPFIGRTNITPTTLDLVRTEIESGISYLKANGFTESLGAQLIDATIVELKAHDTLADRLVVRLNLQIPAPINNIELTLVV